VINFYLGEFSLQTIFKQDSTTVTNNLNTQRLRVAPAFFTTVVILFISTVYKLVSAFLEKERLSIQLKNEKIQHELQFLRSQINPHFLFNALNNLHSIVQFNPQQASDFILKLGEMLRFVVDESQKKQVSIAAEINYIQHFIFFQKEKDDYRQQITFTKRGNGFSHFKLEPMLLIPMVENAFQHNYTDNPNHYFVYIDLFLSDKELIFSIDNNLSDDDKIAPPNELKSGIGLKNITRRLELLYPDQHQLNYGIEGERYKAQLIIQR
jgi:LytS/YehU family sensor histidine kinase